MFILLLICTILLAFIVFPNLMRWLFTDAILYVLLLAIVGGGLAILGVIIFFAGHAIT